MAPGLISVIGTVVGVAGTVMSVRKTAQANRLEQKQQVVESTASRRSAIRAAIIQRAQALSSAQGAGVLNSSGAIGGIGSLTSQLGAQLGYASQMSSLSRGIGRAQTSADLWSSFGNLGWKARAYGMENGGRPWQYLTGGQQPTPATAYPSVPVTAPSYPSYVAPQPVPYTTRRGSVGPI